MRAVLLADASFAVREHAMLERLEVGLTGDGIRVVRAVPESCLEVGAVPQPGGSILHRVVGYEEGLTFLTRRVRARRLAEAVVRVLSGTTEGGGATARRLVGEIAAYALDSTIGRQAPAQLALPAGGGVEIVHCFGEECWPIGLELASILNASVVLEIWRDAAVAPGVRAAARGVPGRGDGVSLFAPDEPMRRACEAAAARREAVNARLVTVPWGVHPGRDLRLARRTGATEFAVAVLASGQDPRATHAALEGIAHACNRIEGLLVFFDAKAARHLGVWEHARRLNLLDRVSLVGSMEAFREPVLHVGMLLQPEAGGEHRTLTLEAMASGVAVAAQDDPNVGWIDGSTALLVPRAGAHDPKAWADRVCEVHAAGEAVQRTRQQAQEMVRASRLASTQIAATLAGYEIATGAETPAEAAGKPGAGQRT